MSERPMFPAGGCAPHGVEDCAICLADIERETDLFLARVGHCECGRTEVLMSPGMTITKLRAWCCSEPKRTPLRLVKS